MFLFLFLLSLLSASNYSAPLGNLNAEIFSSLETNNEIQDVDYLFQGKEILDSEVILVKEIRGKVLLAKKANLEKPIASITKLISAYVSSLIYSPNEIFIFDEESIGQEGNVGWFRVGERISLNKALASALVASSNDSIYLIAKNYGLEDFVSLMNKTTRDWGLKKTTFVEPTGVDKRNISSAYDLSIILEKIYERKTEIFSLTTQEYTTFNKRILWTTNLLLPKYKNYLVGAKTGWTPYAGECLAMILKFPNSPFIEVIILNSKNRWSDAEKIIEALKLYYGK